MPSGSDLLGDVLARLVRGGFVARGEKGQWLLARDLATATLHDLFVCLDLTLGPTDMRGDGRSAWHDRLDALLGAADRTNRERFSVSLKQLLAHEETHGMCMILLSIKILPRCQQARLSAWWPPDVGRMAAKRCSGAAKSAGGAVQIRP